MINSSDKRVSGVLFGIEQEALIGAEVESQAEVDEVDEERIWVNAGSDDVPKHRACVTEVPAV
ncbi:MAG: hypothetical protein ACRYGA_10005 [Janthinobacterium lividum]